MLLAIESSTPIGSVAVADGPRVLAEFSLNVVGAHSAALMPAVDQAMAAAGVTPSELDGVVVGGGPGSFTGLRIAAATAKGIVHALDLPLFAYSSLMCTAVSGIGGGQPVCAMFDARRGDVFIGCWRFADDGPEPVVEPTAMSIDGVVERFGAADVPVFVGDGAWLHRERLRRALGATVLPPQIGAPRASALLWLAETFPRTGAVDDPAGWGPEYVREAGAVRIAAEKKR